MSEAFTIGGLGSSSGGGDVVGPSSATLNQLAIFGNTNGKVIAAYNGTGLLKVTSGVPSIATAGTDYLAATSGSAIQKANGAGGLAAAVAGTDYAPATSGSAILKGDGSGGFAAAVAATDYLAATTGSAIQKANGSGGLTAAVADTDYLSPTAELIALGTLAETSFLVRTGPETYVGRAITVGTGLAVSDGDGIAADPEIGFAAGYNPVGKCTVSAAAGSLLPAVSNGCASVAQAETATNKINYQYLAFDKDAIEYAWAQLDTPNAYNASTWTARIKWAHPAASSNFGVVWKVELVSLSNGDVLDTALGTGVSVTDTGGAAGTLYFSDVTGAITPSNSPAKSDLILARISRVATDGSDTLAADAHLISVDFYFTADAATDD
jgi:hypothetical protein